jgi:hypothetical protein
MATLWRQKPRPRDALSLCVGALLLRLSVVAWAAPRFPPADDGKFYYIVADRIARGLGYTWAWPDGAVTYAAHYPVGYPAILGGVYALVGSSPAAAMLVNAAFGVLGVFAVHFLVASAGQRGPALLAGTLTALHPGLLFYTPALMTEGVTAALLAILAALAVGASQGRKPRLLLCALGLSAGVLVLIRPQALILVPLFGFFARGPGLGARARAAATVTALAVAVCLPWTARNCGKLDRCVLVSANGGWNLFIGSHPRATGAWVSIDELGVPAECRTVFGEAEKDQCFGQAGLRAVLEQPGHYLGLVPRKLSATFDWSGAPGHYLHASNAQVFGERSKLTLGLAEAAFQRLLLLACLIALGRVAGPGRGVRRFLAAVALPFLFIRYAWVAYVLLVIVASVLGRELARRPAVALGAACVAATASTHAVFFGAGRYGLVCVPLLIALLGQALAALRMERPSFDRRDAGG